MSSGIRATVSFSGLLDCPLAECSEAAEGAIEQVSTSVTLPGAEGSVTEFVAECPSAGDVDAEPIFSYGTATVYRTRHDGEKRCPCECLGRHGCPVHRYVADDGELTLVFHAADFETLQAAIEDLRETYSSLDVQQLLQPPLEGTTEERVFVNRGKLTDRQHEALETAYEMGYFERPKGANATEVARRLDITQSTFTEHLMTAQRKLLADILD